MRIDKDRFPALFDDHLVIRHYEPLMDKSTVDIFYMLIREAKQNLFYITQTVMTPILQSYEKLVPLRSELKDVIRGMVFTSKRGHPHVFLYTLTHSHENRINIFCQVSCMAGDKHFGSLFAAFVEVGTSTEFQYATYNYVPAPSSEIMTETLRGILAAELFINYAEIEKKEIQPSRQIWDGPTCLYNNKTRFPITVVDSAWYTHLVSSGAFKVRGHFRLQACGEALKDRKLIWIQDFEKEGYTRKAKIES